MVTHAADGMTCVYWALAPAAHVVSCQMLGSDLSPWRGLMWLTFGNEISDERQWAGTLHRVAIYSEALTPEELATNLAVGSE